MATPRDPATSRKGEHFYKFWVRSVFNGYISAWKLENSKLERKGKTVISLSNEMIWYSLLPLAFCAILTLVAWQLGYSAYWSVPLFFIAQSILAFSLLEIVNYVEHYGIVRKEISPGKYERVNPMHSWNSNHRLSNFFLFQLQRHSDHHANAIKRYQVLKHYDESPQLCIWLSCHDYVSCVSSLMVQVDEPHIKALGRDCIQCGLDTSSGLVISPFCMILTLNVAHHFCDSFMAKDSR